MVHNRQCHSLRNDHLLNPIRVPSSIYRRETQRKEPQSQNTRVHALIIVLVASRLTVHTGPEITVQGFLRKGMPYQTLKLFYGSSAFDGNGFRMQSGNAIHLFTSFHFSFETFVNWPPNISKIPGVTGQVERYFVSQPFCPKRVSVNISVSI